MKFFFRFDPFVQTVTAEIFPGAIRYRFVAAHVTFSPKSVETFP